MIALPRLAMRRASVTLPLCDSSAARLIDLLLEAESTRRVHAWRALLADEPVLTLWGVCWADVQGLAAPRGLDLLADVLSDRALAALASVELTWPDEDASTRVDPAACARLSAAAWQVAENLPESTSVSARDEALLLAHLYNARDWFALLGAEESAACEQLLPSWIRAQLHELEQGGATSDGTPVGLVRAALASLDIKGRSARAAKAREGWNRATHKFERRWARHLPDVGRRLSTLAGQLARLAALETRFEELLEAAKLEAMAEFAAGAGHEMNPPLAVISGRTQLFLRSEEDPERRRELAVINRQAMRVHEMIADMMHFARPSLPEREEIDLVEWLDEALGSLSPLAEQYDIELTCQVAADSLPGWVDATQLTVALRAVCSNAIEALAHQPGSRIEIELVACGSAESQVGPQADDATSSWAKLTIHDNGPGMPAEVRQHAFDPYYSGRAAGRGLGLGLSRCWRIVTQHGGRVELDSRPGAGTTCRMWIPLDRTGQDAEEQPACPTSEGDR